MKIRSFFRTLFGSIFLIFCASSYAGNLSHVKEWNLQVKVSHSFEQREETGYKFLVDASVEMQGTLKDNMGRAGMHFGWPTPAIGQTDMKTCMDLKGRFDYAEISYEPGTNSVQAPSYTETCKATDGKLSVGLACMMGSDSYNLEIRLLPGKLTCTGTDTKEKEASEIIIQIPAQKVTGTNLKGAQTITADGKSYLVDWNFTPAKTD